MSGSSNSLAASQNLNDTSFSGGLPATGPRRAPASPTSAAAAAAGGGGGGSGHHSRTQSGNVHNNSNVPFDPASVKPSAVFVDGQEVTIDPRLPLLFASYAPLAKIHDVTNDVQLNIRMGALHWEAPHKHLGDPAPGFKKYLQIWYGKLTAEQLKEEANFIPEQKPKSLYFALVVVNPFKEARDKRGEINIPADEFIDGYEQTRFNPATFLKDDDFLREGKKYANNFMKLIELLLRLKKRGLMFLPDTMLRKTASPPPDAPYNFFRGWSLDEDQMLTSPDLDEVYIKIHASREKLLSFCEKQNLSLKTNPYSFDAGASAIYSSSHAEELKESVRDYMTHFKIPPQDRWCRGKKNKETGQFEGWGYLAEVPQKARLLLRLLRTPWVFSGCGLQLDEMIEDGVLLLDYMILHNQVYADEYGISRFGDFWGCCCGADNQSNTNQRKQQLQKDGGGELDAEDSFFDSFLPNWEYELLHYYGESVALYFSWMRELCKQLTLPAFVGLILGVLGEVGHWTGLLPYPELYGSIFGCFFILWSAHWITKWKRYEKRFEIRWGQEAEQSEELVRDEFEYDHKERKSIESIFTLDFEFPLTIQRLPSGDIVELVFPNSTRMLRRYCVGWPLLLLVITSMVVSLYFIEVWRFSDLDNVVTSIASSVISVAVAVSYTKIVPLLVDLLCDYENARTTSERDTEMQQKTFLVFFVSQYLALFFIMTFGQQEGSVKKEQRMFEIKVQCITQTAVLPLVQNLVEIITPALKSSFQKRVDTLGGVGAAFCSYFCCCGCCEGCYYDESGSNLPPPKNAKEQAARDVWSQAQLEPYESTSADFLEVTLVSGYSMMFASAFPLMLFFQWMYSILEIKVDAYKLYAIHRRPVPRVARSIGAWNDIFTGLSCLAVVTNSYYMIFVADVAEQIGLDNSEDKKVWSFIVLQYLIGFGALVVWLTRSGASPSVHKNQVKQQLLRDRAIQGYMRQSLGMTPAALKERDAKPLETGDTAASLERHKTENPCEAPDRFVAFFFLLAAIGVGTAALLDPRWLVSDASPAVYAGLTKSCVNDGATCATYNTSLASFGCPSGLSQIDRLWVILAMGSAGVLFAFIALVLVFCVLRGSAGTVLAIRTLMCFLSIACWGVAIVLFYLNFYSCDYEKPSSMNYGLAFWLAVGASGSALVACIISFIMSLSKSCCGKEEVVASKKNRKGRKIPKAPPPPPPGADKKKDEEQRRKEEEEKEAAERLRQQQEEEERNKSVVELTASNEPTAENDENELQPLLVGGVIPLTAEELETAEFDETSDAGLVGLDSSEWRFVPESGYWYSEEKQYYYCHKTNQLGSVETGEWWEWSASSPGAASGGSGFLEGSLEGEQQLQQEEHFDQSQN